MAPQNQQQTQQQQQPSTPSVFVATNPKTGALHTTESVLEHTVVSSPIDHPELLSVFPATTYAPIPELPYHDRALKADPSFKNLLANATLTHLAPKIGTEISGIQLHELTDAQKDELALLVAHRGVVFFRDQAIDMDQQLDLGRYYGTPHIHQYLGHPEGYPEVVVVENSFEQSQELLKTQLYRPANEWHTDVSYERQVRTL